MKLKFSTLTFTPTTIDKENKTIRAVFSTADVDRHGEVVDQKTWNLEEFKTNPVVLFSHMHDQPPVGRVLDVGYGADGSLEGTVQFAADQYPFANVIWNLYRDGYMKAFSVGFAAGRIEMTEDGGVILHDNTLYELSTVSVPANAMALAKSKGLDISALEEKMSEVEKEESTIEEKKEEAPVEVEKAKEPAPVEPTMCPDCNKAESCTCEDPTMGDNNVCTDCNGIITCDCQKKSEEPEEEKVVEPSVELSTSIDVPAIKIPSRKKLSNKAINRAIRQLLEMKR